MILPKRVPIELEFATHSDTIALGLMGRDRLAENSGMLFAYPHPRVLSFWMFNTNFDLSIAFMNTQRIIQQMADLSAFPDMMKTYSGPLQYPVKVETLPKDNPVVDFFLKRQVDSSLPAMFALEVNRGWFKKNGISVGDVVLFSQQKPKGIILKSLNLMLFDTDKARPTLLVFKSEGPLSVKLPTGTASRKVSFFDKNGVVIKSATLEPLHVIYTKTPTKYLLLSL